MTDLIVTYGDIQYNMDTSHKSNPYSVKFDNTKFDINLSDINLSDITQLVTNSKKNEVTYKGRTFTFTVSLTNCNNITVTDNKNNTYPLCIYFEEKQLAEAVPISDVSEAVSAAPPDSLPVASISIKLNELDINNIRDNLEKMKNSRIFKLSLDLLNKLNKNEVFTKNNKNDSIGDYLFFYHMSGKYNGLSPYALSVQSTTGRINLDSLPKYYDLLKDIDETLGSNQYNNLCDLVTQLQIECSTIYAIVQMINNVPPSVDHTYDQRLYEEIKLQITILHNNLKIANDIKNKYFKLCPTYKSKKDESSALRDLQRTMFTNILECYDSDILTPITKELCKTEINDIQKYNMYDVFAFSEIVKDNKVNEYIHHFTHRCPAYIGGKLQLNGINTKKMSELLGYDVSDIKNNLPYDKDRIYTICGRVRRELRVNGEQAKPFIVAHTWGVEFETEKTDNFINGTEKDFEEYELHYRRMFNTLLRALIWNSRNVMEPIVVKIPAIGQNSFLYVLKDKNIIEKYNTIFVNNLNEFAKKVKKNNPENTIVFCDLDAKKYVEKLNLGDKPVFTIETESDALYHINEDKPVFLVSPWNSYSFIGNLLPHINAEYYVVQGHDVNHSNAHNSSFMHNVFFQPKLKTLPKWNPDISLQQKKDDPAPPVAPPAAPPALSIDPIPVVPALESASALTPAVSTESVPSISATPPKPTTVNTNNAAIAAVAAVASMSPVAEIRAAPVAEPVSESAPASTSKSSATSVQLAPVKSVHASSNPFVSRTVLPEIGSHLLSSIEPTEPTVPIEPTIKHKRKPPPFPTVKTTSTFTTSGQPHIAPPMTRKTGQGGKRLKLHTRCAKSKPKGLLRVSRKKK